jgi:hypothetical protein
VLANANGAAGTPTWIQLAPAGTAPAPREYFGDVYDPVTNTMIVFAGDNCGNNPFETFNDVWILSNANGLGGVPTWTQLNPSGTAPGVRDGTSAVYDPSTNRMVIYGGFSSCGCDVWVLSNANGSGGTPTWTQTSPNNYPFPIGRSSHSAVLDPTTNNMTIYGGFDGSGNILNDVWVPSNANGLGGASAWKQLGPLSVFPAGRFGHTAVYDPSTNQMIVFGGQSALGKGITLDDTWVLSHANGM